MNRFLTATMIGVVIGILVAPDKGSETRHHLADNFEKVRDYINKLIGKTDESILELRANLEGELDGLDESIKGKILGIFDDAAKMKDNLKASLLN